jgi:hypothetical protein
MKKTLLTLALVATSVAAFAQGKVTFGNDSNHYFVLGTTLPADNGLGGGTTNTAGNTVSGAPGATTAGPLPSGYTLVAGLYAGTSSTSLALQSSTTSLTGTGYLAPGRMANRSTLLTVAGGTPVFFRIILVDNVGSVLDPASAVPGISPNTSYFGYSAIFSFNPGTGLTYPLLVNAAGWTGNLVVNAVPEPSSFALAGLGMASLLIFRRRK